MSNKLLRRNLNNDQLARYIQWYFGSRFNPQYDFNEYELDRSFFDVKNDRVLRLVFQDILETRKDIKFLASELELCLNKIDEISKSRQLSHVTNLLEFSGIMSELIEKANKNENIKKIGYIIDKEINTISFYLLFNKVNFDTIYYVSDLEVEFEDKYTNLKLEINAIDEDEGFPDGITIFYKNQ